MNKTKATGLLKNSRQPGALFAHLVAIAAGAEDDIDLHRLLQLHARLKRIQRKEALTRLAQQIQLGQIAHESGAETFLSEAQDSAHDKDTYLQRGDRYDRQLEPQLVEVAAWLIDSDNPEHARTTKSGGRSKASDVLARRRILLEELSVASRLQAVSAASLIPNLLNNREFLALLSPEQREPGKSDGYATLMRLLQRDLGALVDETHQVEREEGRYRIADTCNLPELTHTTAVLMMEQLANEVLPTTVQEELKPIFDSAKNKRKIHADSVSPESRWLKAFVIAPARHELDDPLTSPKIKSAVDEAILSVRRVRLEAVTDVYGPGSAIPERHSFKTEGSISHFVLEMPGRIAIEFWPLHDQVPLRIRLEDIKRIEVTRNAASFPSDHVPAPLPRQWTLSHGDALAHDDGQSLIVLRMHKNTLELLSHRRITEVIAVTEESNDWLTVQFRAHATLPLFDYLNSLPNTIILRPTSDSHYARYRMHTTLALYERFQTDWLRHRIQERREEGLPDSYLARLESSAAWRACPTLIEALVNEMWRKDPFNFGPDHPEEDEDLGLYLSIADEVFGHLENAASDSRIPASPEENRRYLALLLEEATLAHAAGRPVKADWAALADTLADAVTDYWIVSTRHRLFE